MSAFNGPKSSTPPALLTSVLDANIVAHNANLRSAAVAGNALVCLTKSAADTAYSYGQPNRVTVKS
eukprot:2067983-Pleurochrysis_carterae.AAC.1